MPHDAQECGQDAGIRRKRARMSETAECAARIQTVQDFLSAALDTGYHGG